ncbi:MAG: DUF429 domain-containing protein [Roseibium sp.]|uniref:DUF429 domain-containing protein n=1 Tax=Roseibium sp. TaxID=1936156 RepID=UPI003D9BFF74
MSGASTIVFGFDSAWTDNPRAPGAICAISCSSELGFRFIEPRLVSFSSALEFILSERSGHEFGLVAIDQPTVVPNETGSRPVDKVAAALVSYVGGGVQPANRSKAKMFGDGAPIWKFLANVDAVQDPTEAQTSNEGNYLIEVFPALALPSLNSKFAVRMSAPKYNPANRKKFKLRDWKEVAATVQATARKLALAELEDWAGKMLVLNTPTKSDQDRLDASICALIGFMWREKCAQCAMIGDLMSGYMITPVSAETSKRLQNAALKQQTTFQCYTDWVLS